ncbi:hypothetical protein B5K06_33000 [Rhizobium grahamii]|uniref:Uncharacterized protein n=1 Tax=Rhizobium grahamii TaxID=1120045 RepID=A0A370KEC9_9HYPH|nr:hypothetical protein B5K06_33000 [Rhizobium grahamii]
MVLPIFVFVFAAFVVPTLLACCCFEVHRWELGAKPELRSQESMTRREAGEGILRLVYSRL